MKWLVEYLLRKIKEYNPEMSEAQLKTRKYGLECIISDLSKFIAYLIIFSLLHMTSYYLISFLFYCSIRTAAGGYHANSYLACFIESLVIFCITVSAGAYLVLPLVWRISILGFSLLLTMIFAPVEHANKASGSENRRRKFKLASIVLICIFGGASFLLPVKLAVCGEVSIVMVAVMMPMGVFLNPKVKTAEAHPTTF